MNGEDERTEAFARWSEHKMPTSYRLAATILRDEVAAQDALQDAVIQAWNAWPRLHDPDRFDAWLDRIIVNRCRDFLRREARITRTLRAVEIDRGPIPDPRIAALRQALVHLSPDHRIALTFRYFDDLSVEEIARRTGAQEGTVKSRLHYGLQALRAAYDATERGGNRQ